MGIGNAVHLLGSKVRCKIEIFRQIKRNSDRNNLQNAIQFALKIYQYCVRGNSFLNCARTKSAMWSARMVFQRTTHYVLH